LKTIVRHHLENAEAERRMKERFEVMLAEREPSPKKPSQAPDDRTAAVFERLEVLMTAEKAYRQCDFSLDKAAAMLGTNRTYLSQAVNERSGSFSQYVNGYRLQEAIGKLSDPEGEESLKSISQSVGFTTPSTFYSLFRQKMGMSPSLFRQNVRNLSAEK
ncbi:MAG: AraC family transcriptional regulator, partial [Muribaculaceae bacterium]|nr:AraC family transcriptional regulator [Muribaculaceae bacterium]